MYSYNENTLINTPYNDVAANTIANMTMHLTLHNKINTKSKRMRDLIRRNTTRQLIVSKPDVKQTSDKAIVTVYIFDREKTMYVRRLFFLKDSLIKRSVLYGLKKGRKWRIMKKTLTPSLINSRHSKALLELKGTDELSLNNLTLLEKKASINKDKPLTKLKKRFFNRIKKKNLMDIIRKKIIKKLRRKIVKKLKRRISFIRRKYGVRSSKVFLRKRLFKLLRRRKNRRFERVRRFFIKRLSYKYRINYKVITRSLKKSFLSKKSIMNNLFMFKFLKWVLSCFNITTYYFKKGWKITLLTSNNNLRNIKLKGDVFILTNIPYKNRIYDTTGFFSVHNVIETNSLPRIRLMNKIMLIFVKNIMKHYIDINDDMRINTDIRKLFGLYRDKYLMNYAMFFLRKERLILSYLTKLYNNRLKYSNLIHAFKSMLGNVYNKSIKLNLVNLKYLHLNSDIFSEAVAIKLRKKKSRLLRTLKRALRLVKIPKIVAHNNKIQNIVKFTEFNLSEINNNINKNYVSKTRSINDMLDNFLLNMFPYEINYNKHKLAHNIIYSIKHKWVRGVRLEAKGRLTKRYTASRSLFKFRYKGTLRNLEHLKKPNYTREQASVVMLRNSIRPNVQYTFTASRKRIGVYGIKGWISGY